MIVYKNKRRRRKAPLVVLIIVLVAALIVIGGSFGYNAYINSTYKIEYQKYVEKYAAENNINKYLVYAVIRTESGFDPNAVSNVGARGLMQIMEDTFEWIKFKCGDDDTVYFDMFDAETNIKYGCYLLGYLSEEFDNVETVMAAYHAGRGNVNQWLSDKRYSSDGVHLDTIPIPDTAHYVDKITKAVKKYRSLYENK